MRPKYLSKAQFCIMDVLVRASGAPLSREQLASAAHCCERTVKRAMPKLVQLGFIKVRHRYAKTGGQLSNSYFVTAKGKRALAPEDDIPQSTSKNTAQPGP